MPVTANFFGLVDLTPPKCGLGSIGAPFLLVRDQHGNDKPSATRHRTLQTMVIVGWKGSSVFSERESLLKCTERFGANLVAATRIIYLD